ncbi:MAG: serine/threonine protein kinase [Treponema sp.]|nr:serine/threonine protein kinase [Treponema sp.]MBR7080611.1 serine/threonine protein kinase [Treponema sp.]
MERECPSHIGKYRNIRFLDEGGMGAVYLAKDPVLDRMVVIKQLKFGRSATNAKDRFKRELSIMNKLTSEHIVRSFEFMEEADERTGRKKDYFVLEYVDGMSLNKLLSKDKHIPLNVLMIIFRDTCLGLSVAHFHNIIHRDIKPANILISRKTVVKLADFGIAGLELEESDEDKKDAYKDDPSIYGGVGMTLSGSTVGTLSYMAPEQMDPSEKVTKRADIYAMGITLYEMIYGRKPYVFQGTLKAQLALLKKMKCVKPPKSNGREKIPLKIRHMIRKMTMVNPKRRYSSISKITKISNSYIKAFDNHDVRVQLAISLVHHPKDEYGYEVIPPKNRIPKIAALSALAIAALVGLFAFAWKQGIFHKTILRHWYTPVTINLSMPETKSVKADLPARVFFYYNDNDSIPDVPGSQRDFIPSKNKKDKSGSTIVSIKPVYLKHGDYRIKIAAGPSVWWKDLRIDHDAVSLDLDYLKAEKRKIKISLSAVDDETGEDISNICSCKIQTDEGLKDLWTINPNTLKTGDVYKLYIKSEEYQDEYFSLLIDWYQDELYINARMKKIEAKIGDEK